FSCCLISGIPPQLWRYTSLARSAVAHVDTLIAPSEFTARLHREAGFTSPITVLPLFSALQPPRPSDRPRSGRPTFLFVGRVTTPKGLIPLLRQFTELPDYDLLIAGEGDIRERLESEYASFSNIRFLGPVPQAELFHFYETATALIFP